MIERKFIAQKIKEFQIQEFVTDSLNKVGHSHTKLQRTPLGEKIIIYASRPGLIIGRKGENINKLTQTLKTKFKLENPQIEINEVDNINLDAQIVAEKIASTLERFGASKFKGIGHKTMFDVIGAGALGIEIIVSGKIPGSRAKSWRFYQGYLKKCGDVAIMGVRKAQCAAQLKTGTVGIKVSIMPPDIELPDNIILLDEIITEVEEKDVEGKAEETKEAEPKKTKKKVAKKEKKTTESDEEVKEETTAEKAEEKVEDEKEGDQKSE